MLVDLVQTLFSALTIGSMYALIAVGVTLVYSATRIINFAQGEFVMLGGMVMVSLYGERGWPLWLAILATVAVTVVAAALLTRVSYRAGQPGGLITVLIITIGASMGLSGGAYHLWGGDVHRFAPFSGDAPIDVLGAAVAPQSLWVIGVTAVVVVLLWFFLKRTIWGKAMRACAIDRTAASLMGIRVGRTVTLSFVLAGVLGCVAGIVMTPLTMIDYSGGMLLAIKGFSAAMLGGMGSVAGAVLGGLVFATLESFSMTFVSSTLKELVTFVVIILVLMFLPNGLLGARERSSLAQDELLE
ncbi:MAG: branched-chain amino acid ABC transporter permease [Burkholderiaceae bacterium]|nr:branched-chain amino acid ABC transporter permease [Burkholderiaceae bacterium]